MHSQVHVWSALAVRVAAVATAALPQPEIISEGVGAAVSHSTGALHVRIGAQSSDQPKPSKVFCKRAKLMQCFAVPADCILCGSGHAHAQAGVP